MLYTILKVGTREYKCRLTAKSCVDLEKRMGGNPLNVFMNIQKTQQMPKLEEIIMIIHASMQAYEHGITLDNVYEIYDEFVDEGNSLMEVIPIIMEIFRVSGFFKVDEVEERKNAIVEKK